MRAERRPKYPRPWSPSAIEECTKGLRELIGVGDTPYFNIISVVENGLSQRLPRFVLEVWSRDRLGKVEAFTEYGPVRMAVREDIYLGAHKDDSRGRFTIAHELGHLCLHWGFPRPRLAPSAQKPNDPSPEGRMENEANQFAAFFLMPQVIAKKIDEPRRLARLCRVSDTAASYRLHNLWGQNENLTSDDVRKLFGTT